MNPAQIDAPSFIASDLYELSRALGERDPDRQSHGLFGGEWGYGNDFANDTFEMFPFYWGDCDCGYEDAEEAWSEDNDHTPECFHTEYMAFHDRLSEPWSDRGQKASLDWLNARGITSTFGVLMRCDCGYQERWESWVAEHSHAERCPSVRPNFKHFATGVEVRWYKYIGRSMTVNQDIGWALWRSLIAECAASLAEVSA